MIIKKILSLRYWYKRLPFKKYICIGLKTYWNTQNTPNFFYQKKLDELSFEGKFQVKNNNSFSFYLYNEPQLYIENNLFWTAYNESTYEISSYVLWARLSKLSSVILDIGANSGTFSLLSRAVNTSATVFAFEPLDKNFQRLKRHNKINSYNINCIQKAVSNKDGISSFYVQNTMGSYGSTLNSIHRFDNTTYSMQSVETIRLDDFIEKNNIQKIDLVKIDVEKHELEVLEGLGIYLNIFYPNMIIEIMDENIAQKIQDLININQLEYDYYFVSERAPYVTKFESIQKIGASKVWGNYLICKPSIAKKIGLHNRIERIDKMIIDV